MTTRLLIACGQDARSPSVSTFRRAPARRRLRPARRHLRGQRLCHRGQRPPQHRHALHPAQPHRTHRPAHARTARLHRPCRGQPEAEWKLKSRPRNPRPQSLRHGDGFGRVPRANLPLPCRATRRGVGNVRESQSGRSSSPRPKAIFPPAIPRERLIPADPAERLAIARRYVADRCLYGVDINPMAVEMAKLSLWLITLQRDRPFTFLDHALKCGDSLLGFSLAARISGGFGAENNGTRAALMRSSEIRRSWAGRRSPANSGTDYRNLPRRENRARAAWQRGLLRLLFSSRSTRCHESAHGMAGLVATNTIAQGDSREVGLEQTIAAAGTIVPRAVSSRPWPGDAALEVARTSGCGAAPGKANGISRRPRRERHHAIPHRARPRHRRQTVPSRGECWKIIHRLLRARDGLCPDA